MTQAQTFIQVSFVILIKYSIQRSLSDVKRALKIALKKMDKYKTKIYKCDLYLMAMVLVPCFKMVSIERYGVHEGDSKFTKSLAIKVK